jgi:thioredoxin reductase (NADPH)
MTLVDGNTSEIEVDILAPTIAPPTLCYDIVIIGGGVAGLSAAIYAARDGFKTLVLEGELVSSVDMPGGALLLTESIENFPGFVQGEGAELVGIIRGQAEGFGAEILTERVTDIDFSLKAGELHQVYAGDNYYKAKSVILATGAVARQLNVPGEEIFYGHGVSTCATCDGFFFKEKTVAVVGGGDTAVEDALFLTRYAEKVYLLPRGKELRASGPEAREILDHPKVEILWESTVEEIIGDEMVIGVIYKQHGELKDLPLDGVFVAIGRDPATSFLRNGAVMTDRDGYIQVVEGSTRVQGAIPGVYAAGDCVDKVFKQAITSAGKAVEAALEARHYLLSPLPEPIKRVTNRY